MKSMKFTKKMTVMLLAAVLMFAGVACRSDAAPSSGGEQDYSGVTIRIAQQYAMHFAPVSVAEKLGLIEKRLPGVNLEWSKMAGGSAINEAMIAGQLDAAVTGIPPALIAWAQGADFKMGLGICVPACELMVKSDTIKSIEDLKPTDKIAVPGVGSLQHIMLAMAAENILGDAKALDNNLVTMAAPDAYTALVSGTDIAGHFTNLPYIDLEEKDGCTSILKAREAYGQDFTSPVFVTTKAFHDEQGVAYKALTDALAEAIDLVNAKDPEAIKIIAEVEKISEEDVLRYIEWSGTSYDAKIYGAMGLATFMYEQGFINKLPESAADFMWDEAEAVD